MATPSEGKATNESTNMNETTTKETQGKSAMSVGGEGGESSGGDTMSDSGAVTNDRNDVFVDNGAANDSVRGHGNTGKMRGEKTGDKASYDAISTDSYNDEGKLKWRQCEQKKWIFSKGAYYSTDLTHLTFYDLYKREGKGEKIRNEEWGNLDYSDGEPVDRADRKTKGKEGIDDEGWWQDMEEKFHQEVLSAKQVERIKNNCSRERKFTLT